MRMNGWNRDSNKLIIIINQLTLQQFWKVLFVRGIPQLNQYLFTRAFFLYFLLYTLKLHPFNSLNKTHQ